MTCLPCGREFHSECDSFNSDTDSCCCGTNTSIKSEQSTAEGGDNSTRGAREVNHDVTISAGRKRAAREYDIDENQPCEWRGKINCGGGFIPVPGCAFGFQVDRHHGPDKNTTNNSRDNIHLICKNCHNLWHRRNDPLYGEAKCPDGITLHLPKWATFSEIPSLIVKEDV